jgi:hypothetical protein
MERLLALEAALQRGLAESDDLESAVSAGECEALLRERR